MTTLCIIWGIWFIVYKRYLKPTIRTKHINKFRKWVTAHTTNYPVWRVTYQDGERTYCLPYLEARGLKQVFNGKMWIDYDKGFF